MKSIKFVILLFLAVSFSFCQQIEIDESPTEGEEEGGGYRKYYEESRRAALGENWEQITKENAEQASQARLFPAKTVFAGGALEGNWFERGGSTVAGSIGATAFYAPTEEIYAISERGVLLKGDLTGSPWAILNDLNDFNELTLAVVPNGAGKRIVTSKSTDRLVYYSDNDGTTWTQATGVTYGSANGQGGKQLLVLNNGDMFLLAHASSSTYRLFRSTNKGVTWTQIQSFSSATVGKVSMWSPFNTNELYVIHNGTSLYSWTAASSTFALLNTNTTIATNVDYSLTGFKNGSALTLYVLAADANLYKSTDNGASWSNTSNLTTTAWSVGMVANPWVADALYYGAVNFYKSTSATPNFSAQNGWGSYYGNIDLLHADIMSITPYQKTDGTQFFLIGNHGGIHYFPAPFTTTTNLTKTGIRNADYYDVATIDGVIFAGAQDQGNQRFSGASGTDILTASQLTSGDFVRINSSVNGTKYWHEYPQTGASCPISYYDSPLTQNGSTAGATIYGTSGTNMQYWVTPTCNWSVASENSMLIGGGGISSGATTSQLIKLTYNGSSITKAPYAFDFKANGSGYITALDHSPANANYMYVALNNGKFYYSHDAGTNWTQTAGFTGPGNDFTYGAFIHASRNNPLLAFYCGSGGKVYKTADGGVSFSDMSVGLPNTFVNELTLNSAESLLFAATDAGPYVCVLSTGQWYSMATPSTPVKEFRAVEWVESDNTVRFATYGRGIWDFQITYQQLPVSYQSFEAKAVDNQYVALNWATETERDLLHFEVQKSSDGVNFTTISSVKARNRASQYTETDKFPTLNAVNYYRIKSVDVSGKKDFTPIKSAIIHSKNPLVHVYPTILSQNSPLFVQSDITDGLFFLTDQQGRVLMQQKMPSPVCQLTLPSLSSGIYFYSIREANRQLVKTGKLMVL